MHGFAGNLQRCNADLFSGEVEAVHAAERRMQLVLHADIFFQDFPFDFHRLAGEIDLGASPVHQEIDDIQKADGESRRRTETAARRREIGHDGNVEPLGNIEITEHFAHDRMLDLSDIVGQFDARITDAVIILLVACERQRRDIDIFVDGHAHDSAGDALEIFRIIGAPAE